MKCNLRFYWKSAGRDNDCFENYSQAYLRTFSNIATYQLDRNKLEGELLQAALKHGLSVVPYYGLANGFLAGKYREKDDLTKSPRGQRSAQYLEGRGMRVLGALDQVAAETGEALATIALAWTSAQPGIAATLASATSVDQLQELMASMTLKLTSDQLALLAQASS